MELRRVPDTSAEFAATPGAGFRSGLERPAHRGGRAGVRARGPAWGVHAAKLRRPGAVLQLLQRMGVEPHFLSFTATTRSTR